MAGTITAATLDSGAAGTAPVFNASGTQIGTLCRAWVTLGTNAAIVASFNVSSVTNNGTGDLTVTFTNALPDAKYAIGACAGQNASNLDCVTQPSTTYPPAAGSCRFAVVYANGNYAPYSYASITFFR